jgi:hypothetical protein
MRALLVFVGAGLAALVLGVAVETKPPAANSFVNYSLAATPR